MLATLFALAALGIALPLVAWAVRRYTRVHSGAIRGVGIVLAISLCVTSVLSLVPAVYLAWCLAAGQPELVRWVIAPGVTYERRVLKRPRQTVAHIAQIELNDGYRFAASAPVQTPDGWRCRATVPTQAMRDLHADLLVNASFFEPFHDRHLLDYRPHAGELADPYGFTLGDGQPYGQPRPGWPSFWSKADGTVGIGKPPADAVCAVSGRQWLLRGGKATRQTNHELNPRTVLGMDRSRRHLWLVVVDGRQPNYSMGMNYVELQALLLGLGATNAIELDGGGSSTLVVREKSGNPGVLNRPCHTKIPGRERPVANCLGIRFPASKS